MIRPAAKVAAVISFTILISGLAPVNADPVKDNLRKLKAKLKAAKSSAKPAPTKPAPASTPVPRTPVRAARNRPRPAPPKPKPPPMPELTHSLVWEKTRLGTIPKTGDIRVETINRGKIVFAYWGVYKISDQDGNGVKLNLAPARYKVQLKGPSMVRPWVKYVQVKPDMVAVLKVELPEDN